MAAIGINGFGRIGRMILRVAIRSGATVVAINDPNMNADYMAYLFKHDSTQRAFKGNVSVENDCLLINGVKIRVYSEENPADIKWHISGAIYVIECSGMFTSTERAALHLQGGAKKVIISAMCSHVPLFVYGINMQDYRPEMKVICTGSGAINSCAPIIRLMHQNFGIVEGFLTIVHAFTAQQNTVDEPVKKVWRDGRGAAQNIIPGQTCTAKAIGIIMPELAGKLSGISFRVPTPNVSVIDLTLRLQKATTYRNIKKKFAEAANGDMARILGYTKDKMVSTDFIGDTHSAIFDAGAGIQHNENFVKLVAWFDNEVAFANRIIDLIDYIQEIDGKSCVLYN